MLKFQTVNHMIVQLVLAMFVMEDINYLLEFVLLLLVLFLNVLPFLLDAHALLVPLDSLFLLLITNVVPLLLLVVHMILIAIV